MVMAMAFQLCTFALVCRNEADHLEQSLHIILIVFGALGIKYSASWLSFRQASQVVQTYLIRVEAVHIWMQFCSLVCFNNCNLKAICVPLPITHNNQLYECMSLSTANYNFKRLGCFCDAVCNHWITNSVNMSERHTTKTTPAWISPGKVNVSCWGSTF